MMPGSSHSGLLVSATAGTIVVIFLAVVLAAGYVALWAIWHFFFRGR